MKTSQDIEIYFGDFLNVAVVEKFHCQASRQCAAAPDTSGGGDFLSRIGNGILENNGNPRFSLSRPSAIIFLMLSKPPRHLKILYPLRSKLIEPAIGGKRSLSMALPP